MAKDVFDKSMAKQFAWMGASAEGVKKLLNEPSIHAKAPEPVPPPKLPTTEEEQQAAEEKRLAFVREAQQKCGELAAQVNRVWAIQSMETQARHTRRLARTVEKMAFSIVPMENHPVENLRLWRLVIRHLDRIPRSLRVGLFFTLGFMSPPTHLNDIVELFVEAAEHADSWLNFVLQESITEAFASRKFPELGQKLSNLVTKSKSWDTRLMAAHWLGAGRSAEGIPALKQALTEPHAELRTAALEALLAMGALEPGEVQWQLDDSVEHPLPEMIGSPAWEVIYNYSTALFQAVQKLPPPEGYRPLEKIVDNQCKDIQGKREGTDSSWALRALAAGYPERALSRIDTWLLADRYFDRYHAVEAAGELPDELARPRLLEGAVDPGHSIAEKAKELYFKRFNEPCPLPRTAGIPMEMLKQAPSEAFESRFSVLRGKSDDARKAMLIVLHGELKPLLDQEGLVDWDAMTPEQRETLVLILSCLPELRIYPAPEKIPSNIEGWAQILIPRFGKPVFDYWLKFARPEAFHGVDHRVLGSLASHSVQKMLSDEQKDQLRALGTEAMLSPTWPISTTVPMLLMHVIPPPQLLDRLWEFSIHLETKGDAHWKNHYCAVWCGEAIRAMPPSEELDRKLTEWGIRAYETRDFETFERVVIRLGCRRNHKESLALAERCLAELDEHPELIAIAGGCKYSLAQADLLPESWVFNALSHPESLTYAVAVGSLWKDSPPSHVDLALRGLDSPARNGAAAAESLERLIYRECLSLDDPRIPLIIEKAPLKTSMDTLRALLYMKMPLEPLRKKFMEALTCSDDEIAKEALDVLYSNKQDDALEFLEEVWAKGPNPAIISTMEYWMDKPSETALYWQDNWEEGKEEGESGDDDEDQEDDEDDGLLD